MVVMFICHDMSITIEAIPEELLHRIVGYLSQSDKLCLSATCTALRACLKQSLVWREVRVNTVCDAAHVFLTTVAKECEELHVRGGPVSSVYELTCTLPGSFMKSLRWVYLTIPNATVMSPFRLLDSLSSAPHLETIDITIGMFFEQDVVIVFPSKPDWKQLTRFSFVEHTQSLSLCFGLPGEEYDVYMPKLTHVSITCHETDFMRHASRFNLKHLSYNCVRPTFYPPGPTSIDHLSFYVNESVNFLLFNEQFRGTVVDDLELHVMDGGCHIQLTHTFTCKGLSLVFYQGVSGTDSVVVVPVDMTIPMKRICLSSKLRPCPPHSIVITGLPRDMSPCVPLLQKVCSDFAYGITFEQDPWLDLDFVVE